jgi:hypothetical protein
MPELLALKNAALPGRLGAGGIGGCNGLRLDRNGPLRASDHPDVRRASAPAPLPRSSARGRGSWSIRRSIGSASAAGAPFRWIACRARHRTSHEVSATCASSASIEGSGCDGGAAGTCATERVGAESTNARAGIRKRCSMRGSIVAPRTEDKARGSKRLPATYSIGSTVACATTVHLLPCDRGWQFRDARRLQSA